MSKQAIVIGSGIAGIATSIRLACQGFAVSVFEKNEYAGGKLSSFSLGDYRFDFGPSLFTMPHFVDELFELAGENPREHFQYKRKEIGCKYYWEDGVRLHAYGDTDRFLQEVDDKLGVPKHQLQDYLTRAEKKYKRTVSIFLEQSLHKLDTYLNKATVKGILHLFSYELETTLHKVNTRRLKESHLVQFYDRFATYNGSNPYQTPGMMTLTVGMMILSTRLETILPNAPPIMTPTARSITLPLNAKCLNSSKSDAACFEGLGRDSGNGIVGSFL